MSIDDRREFNRQKQQRMGKKQSKPHSIKRDPVTGKYSAIIQNGKFYQKKIYTGNGDVKFVSVDAFEGKNAVKRIRERGLEGYLKGQIFNNATEEEAKKPKKIKYVYSVTDQSSNLIEFYVGGHQKQSIKLPFTLPATIPVSSESDTNRTNYKIRIHYNITIDNLGSSSFAINLAYVDLPFANAPINQRKIVFKYYKNIKLQYEKFIDGTEIITTVETPDRIIAPTVFGHGAFYFSYRTSRIVDTSITLVTQAYEYYKGISLIDGVFRYTDEYLGNIDITDSTVSNTSTYNKFTRRLILDSINTQYETIRESGRNNRVVTQYTYFANGSVLFNENDLELTTGNDFLVMRPSPSKKTWLNRKDEYIVNYFGSSGVFQPEVKRYSTIIRDGIDYSKYQYYSGNIRMVLITSGSQYVPEPQQTTATDFFTFNTQRTKVSNYTIYGDKLVNPTIKPKKIIDVTDNGFSLGEAVVENGETKDIEWAILTNSQYAKYNVSKYSLQSDFLTAEKNLLVYPPEGIDRLKMNLLGYSYNQK